MWRSWLSPLATTQMYTRQAVNILCGNVNHPVHMTNDSWSKIKHFVIAAVAAAGTCSGHSHEWCLTSAPSCLWRVKATDVRHHQPSRVTDDSGVHTMKKELLKDLDLHFAYMLKEPLYNVAVCYMVSYCLPASWIPPLSIWRSSQPVLTMAQWRRQCQMSSSLLSDVPDWTIQSAGRVGCGAAS